MKNPKLSRKEYVHIIEPMKATATKAHYERMRSDFDDMLQKMNKALFRKKEQIDSLEERWR